MERSIGMLYHWKYTTTQILDYRQRISKSVTQIGGVFVWAPWILDS